MTETALAVEEIDALTGTVAVLLRAIDAGELAASAAMRSLLVGARAGLLVAVGRMDLEGFLLDAESETSID